MIWQFKVGAYWILVEKEITYGGSSYSLEFVMIWT
jgi:hypothetical protein